MSDTPETDAAVISSNGQWSFVLKETCRRIERERDEAREELKHITEYGTEEINAAVDLRQKLASALIERDEARKKYDTLATEHMLVVNKLCKERDELLNEIKRLRLDAQRESEHHDSMVRELEKVYKERDDARKELEEYRSIAENIGATKAVSEKEQAIRERDEAREVIRNIVRAGRVGRQWQSYAIEFLEKLEETK